VTGSKANLKHTKWGGKYHGVDPEVSRQGDVRVDTQRAWPIKQELAQQKESEVEEGHLMGDHT